MTDKQLLELAAKAAGIDIEWALQGRNGGPWATKNGVSYAFWNPLTEDGDALRLAVRLKMEFHFEEQFQQECIEVLHSFEDNKHKAQCVLQELGVDPYAATRRAIVCAAAEIGKTVTP